MRYLFTLLLLVTIGCTPAPIDRFKDLTGTSSLDQFGVAEFQNGFHEVVANVWAYDSLYLVTCEHVVDRQIRPWTVNGHEATLAYKDDVLDIAILKCPSHGLQPNRIRVSHIGESANLVGYLPDEPSGRSVYVGSGKVNSLRFRGGYLYNGGCHPGISGSPLFGEDGAAIGMVKGYIDCRGSANTTHTRIADPLDILTALQRARLGVRRPPLAPTPAPATRPASRPATRPATAPSK